MIFHQEYIPIHSRFSKGTLLLVNLFFILIPLLTPAQPVSFHFNRFTDTEGLSDGFVHAFVQDKYGFMWIGTTYGLNRFDGIHVKNYFAVPADSTSLIDNEIESLFMDSAQQIWVGTRHGLCRYDECNDLFIRYPGGLNPGIYDIIEDSQHQFWLATTDGLYQVNEQKIH